MSETHSAVSDRRGLVVDTNFNDCLLFEHAALSDCVPSKPSHDSRRPADGSLSAVVSITEVVAGEVLSPTEGAGAGGVGAPRANHR